MSTLTKQEIKDIQEENLQLKIALEEIENRLKWLKIDCHEGDKVLCHAEAIRHSIINAYPEYKR